MLKKFNLFVLIFLLFTSTFGYYKSENQIIFFNGEQIKFTKPILMHNSRLHVPVNELAVRLNKTVINDTHRLLIKDSVKEISIAKNLDLVVVNDEKYYLPNHTFISNEDLYMPLSYLAWYLGYNMNIKDNITYISKRIREVENNNGNIRVVYACEINDADYKSYFSKGVQKIELLNSVLSFSNKYLSVFSKNDTFITQVNVRPDKAAIVINTNKELSYTIKDNILYLASNQEVINIIPKSQEKPVVLKEEIEILDGFRASEKAVWLPSFENIKDIKINVKGKESILKGLSIIKNNQLYVPADPVLSPFGYTFWLNEQNELMLRYAEKTIVNTKVKAIYLNNEIFIPLQDVARKTGFGLRWDYRIHTLFINPIIYSVNFQNDALDVHSYHEIVPNDIFYLNSPERVVMDIPNAVADTIKPIFENSKGNIIRMKIAQFDEKTVRVVADLKHKKNYSLQVSDDGLKAGFVEAGKIEKLFIASIINGNKIILEGAGLSDTSWKVEDNSLIMDIKGASYAAKNEYQFSNEPIITNVVGSQKSWDPLVSRMVFYFKQKPNIEVKKFNEKIEITFISSHSIIKPTPVIISKSPMRTKLTGKKIVIEPGHGGYDVGAIGIGGKYEKWFTLDTSKRIAKLLREHGAIVLMPLEEDQFQSLSARVQFANRNKAELYISVHFNSFTDSRVNGVSTYYYTESNRLLAHKVQEAMVNELGWTDGKLRKSRLFVLFHTNMPAILIEPGFISNPKDYNELLKPENRDKIALGVLKGLMNYYE